MPVFKLRRCARYDIYIDPQLAAPLSADEATLSPHLYGSGVTQCRNAWRENQPRRWPPARRVLQAGLRKIAYMLSLKGCLSVNLMRATSSPALRAIALRVRGVK